MTHAQSKYPEFFRHDHAFDRRAYQQLRAILLDYVQDRRYANGKELEQREVARTGLVRLRYGYYVIGAIHPEIDV